MDQFNSNPLTARSSPAQSSVLSGKLGMVTSALGAFHKKPAPAPAPAAGGGTSVVLMETTSQESNFSQDPVPDSAF